MAWEALNGRLSFSTIFEVKFSTLAIWRVRQSARGAKAWPDLPNHLDSFTAHWVREHEGDSRTDWATKGLANFARNPIQQLLQQLLPDYSVRGSKQWTESLVDRAPGFFDYLRRERGLRNTTLRLYIHSLRRLERYLRAYLSHRERYTTDYLCRRIRRSRSTPNRLATPSMGWSGHSN